jgi:hypothetical protein
MLSLMSLRMRLMGSTFTRSPGAKAGAAGRGGAARQVGFHVLLGHPAHEAGALDGGQVDPRFPGHAPHQRAGPGPEAALQGVLAGFPFGRRGFAGGGIRPGRGGGDPGRCGGGDPARGGGGLLAGGADAAHHRAHRHRGVGLHQDLQEGPGHRRGNLGVHLVRGDFIQGLVLADGLPRLSVPLEDGGLGDGLSHLRHDDVEGHG